MKRHLVFLLCYFCFSIPLLAQYSSSGTKFWLAFFENNSSNPKTVLYLSAEHAASGTVRIPGTGWNQNFNIPANGAISVVIPTSQNAATSTANTVLNRGILVTSNSDISVYAANEQSATSDATLVFPVPSLGDSYVVTTYTPLSGSSPSEFVVVGTQDGTNIEIIPRSGVSGGVNANVPFTITLNEGQIYLVKGRGDLSGSIVRATDSGNCNNFAVFAGNKCANVPTSCRYCDHLYEQMIPTKAWGKEYITSPLMTRIGGDLFRITPCEDNTILKINGTITVTLNTGQTYERLLPTASYIRANKPISVAQYSRGGECDGVNGSDPFMIMLSPVEQAIEHIVFQAVQTGNVNQYHTNIITQTAHTGSVILDGSTIPSWTVVAENPIYSYARLNVSQGTHIISSPYGVLTTIYGFGSVESYGYLAGAKTVPLDVSYDIIHGNNPPVSYDNYNEELGCQGNNLLQFRTTSLGISSIQWDFGDGSPREMGNQVSHSFPYPGQYKVTMSFLRDGSCMRDSIFATIKVNNKLPDMDLLNDSILCNETSFSYNLSLPQFTYLWQDGSTNSSYNVTASGNYSVTVTDQYSCSTSSSARVDFVTLTASAVITDSDCNSYNGSIVVTPSGTSSSFTYLWDTIPPVTNNTLSGIGGGTYTVTISDSYGCSISNDYDVSEVELDNATINITNIDCSTNNFGTASISLNEGTAPYSINWSDASISGLSPTNLAVGSYYFTITDANNCTYSDTITITSTQSLAITNPLVDTTVCNGNSFTVQVNNSTDSYLWQDGSTDFNYTISASGNYTVTVTDKRGCSTTTSARVDFVSLSATAAVNNIDCHGNGNGNITVTPAGTSSSFNYLWSDGATTNTISSLTDGTYTLTITDTYGCSISDSYVIVEPPLVNISHSTTPVVCNTGVLGSATVTTTSGNPPFTIAWSNPAASGFNPTNLPGGTYSYTVTDINNCAYDYSFVIDTIGMLVLANPLRDTTVCNGNSFSVMVNDPANTYLWQDGSTSANYTFSTSGNYSVTVTDALGCTLTSANRVDFVELSATAAVNDIDCHGNGNGNITVTPAGTASSFNYLWSNGATTNTISSLTDGNYTLTITDSYGCSISDSYVIVEPPLVNITFSTTDIVCSNSNFGAADVTVTSGTPPHNITWSESNVSGFNPANLAAGNYSFTVTDDNNCQYSYSFTINTSGTFALSNPLTDTIVCNGNNFYVNVNNPNDTYLWQDGSNDYNYNIATTGNYAVTVTDPRGCTATTNSHVDFVLLSATAAVNDIDCHGNGNGNITVTPAGTSPSFNYLWSNGATTNTISSLTDGTYTLTITDSYGCSISDSYVIVEPPLVNISHSTTPVVCNTGILGSATVTTTSGNPPFTIAWSNPAASGFNPTNLPGGTYSYTVTDINNCAYNYSFDIDTIGMLVLANPLRDTTVCNGNSFSVMVNDPANTYLWQDGSTSANYTFSTSGNYSVTVTDALGCTLTSANRVDFVELSATAAVNDIDCHGNGNGNITVTPAGTASSFNYLWNNGATTNTISSLTDGTYTLTITDSYGCSISDSYVIVEPPLVNITYTTTDIVCSNSNFGAADVTVTSGTPPHNITWSESNVSGFNPANLAAGNYSFTVTDDNNCQYSYSFTINTSGTFALSNPLTDTIVCNGNNFYVNVNNPNDTYLWQDGSNDYNYNIATTGNYAVTVTDPRGCTATTNSHVDFVLLSATAAVNDIDCHGNGNGNITVTPAGTSPSFNYLWNNGATTNTISSLTDGTYTLTITDSYGCSISDSYVIVEPPLVNISHSTTPVVCNTGILGSATVTTTSGNPPFSITWSNPAASGFNPTNLPGGTYSYTVTDINNCAYDYSFVIDTIGMLVLANPLRDTIVCNGNSFSVMVNDPANTYLWQDGSNSVNYTFSTSGNYSVTVTDALGCTLTSANRVDFVELSATAAVNDIDCHGNGNGNITVTPAGTASSFNYLWSNSATTNTISNLTDGTYTLTITDSYGCSISDSYVIVEPPLVNITFTTTDIVCSNSNFGAADVTVTSGTPPHNITWSESNVSGFNPANLASGNYSFTVTDDNNCQYSYSFTINTSGTFALSNPLTDTTVCNGNNFYVNVNNPNDTYLWQDGSNDYNYNIATTGNYAVTVTDPRGCTATTNSHVDFVLLSATAAVNDIDCHGNGNGNITVTPAGTSPSFNYLWNNGAITNTISSLTDGTYTLTITDSYGCSISDSYVIVEPPLVNISHSTTPVVCNTGILGSATVTTTSGNPPFSIAWSNPAASGFNPTNLPGGTYSYTVTDINNCAYDYSFDIDTIGMLVLANPLRDTIVCNGNVFSVMVNDPANTYLWQDGSNSANYTFSTSGNYSVTVTDALGCTLTSANRVDFVLLSSTAAVNDIDCHGNGNGNITVTPAGTSSSFNYLWSNGATTNTISSLTDGNYTLTITDTYGCSISNSYTIIEPPLINISYTTTDIVCSNLNFGAANVTVANGNPPFSIAWSESNVSGYTPNNLAAGNYSFTVSDANNCQYSYSFTINTSGTFALSNPLTDTIVCNGNNFNVNVNSPNDTYLWQDGSNDYNYNIATTGNYAVTVTDPRGCTATTNSHVDFVLLSATAAVNDIDCHGNGNGNITVTPAGTSPSFNYLWSNGAITNTISSLTDGTYTLTITDSYGCSISDSYVIVEPALVNISHSTTPVVCNTGVLGSATVTTTSGNPPFSIAWSNPAASGFNPTNLPGGTYSYTVTDINNCAYDYSFDIDTIGMLVLANPLRDTTVCNGNSFSVTVDDPANTYLWQDGSNSVNYTFSTSGNYSVTVTDALGCTLTSANRVDFVELSATAAVVNIDCHGNGNGSITVTPTGTASSFTYLWSNTSTTNPISNLNDGVYALTITDSYGCSITDSYTIVEPPLANISYTTTDIVCSNLNFGSANITVTSGTPPHNITWSDSNVSGFTPNNLLPGNYSFTVSDANNCQYNYSIFINQSGNLALLNPLTDTIVCNGNSFSVRVNNANDTYLWQDGRTDYNYTINASGNYAVTVTDARGCSAATNANVNFVDLNTTAVVNNIDCHGNANGSISLTTTGTSSSFNYIWNNTNTSNSITNLDVGTYTVTISDTYGCSLIESYNITSPPLINILSNINDITCNNNNLGSASITLTSGNPPFNISWSDPLITGYNAVNLQAGSYSYSITDANNCQYIRSFDIDLVGSLTLANPLVDTAVCNGTSYTLVINNPGDTYLWNDGSTNSSYTFTNSGDYSVSVTDSRGCSVVSSARIDFVTLSATAVVNDVECFGNSTGSIVLTPSGTSTTFSYLWNTTPAQTSQTASNLGTGSYDVTITDSYGCAIIESYNIISPPLIDITTTTTDVMCNTSNLGSVVVDLQSGNPPFTIIWSDPSIQGLTPNNLQAGDYSYTISDANNCEYYQSFTIELSGYLNLISPLRDSVICNGNPYNTSVSTSNNSYVWQDGSTNHIYQIANTGDYSVTVTDIRGCSASSSCHVDFVDLANTASVTNILCDGDSDGIIVLNPSGTSSSFNYLWNTTPPATSGTLRNLPEGIYIVTITDSYGCSVSESYTIAPNLPTITLTTSNIICNTNTWGSANINVQNGVGPFSIQWSDPTLSGFRPNDLSSGNYAYTIVDNNNCEYRNSFVININGRLNLRNPLRDTAVCNGSEFYIEVNSPNNTYLWQDGTNSYSYLISQTGDYSVTVTDIFGCEAISSNHVDFVTLNAQIAIDPISCYGENDATLTVTAQGTSSSFNYLWNTTPAVTSNILSGIGAGSYTVTVKDSYNCSVSLTEVLNIEELGININSLKDVQCFGANNGSVNIIPQGGTSPYEIHWHQPTITGFTPQNLNAGQYVLTVTDAHGCRKVSYFTITEPSSLSAIKNTTGNTLCFDSNNMVTIIADGGVSPYTILWDDGSDSFTNLNVPSNIAFGYTITDINNCNISDNVYIATPSVIEPNAIISNITCKDENTGSITLNISGGAAPYTTYWSNNSNKTSITNLIAGNYSVTIIDNNNCEINYTFPITEPANRVEMTLIKADASCYNKRDGAILLDARGGTEPYSYVIQGTTKRYTSSHVTDLKSDTYYVAISDRAGCKSDTTIIIYEPEELLGSYIMNLPSCIGINDGSIEVNVSGGTEPYRYKMNGNENIINSPLFEELKSGNYDIEITDSANCILSLFNISLPEANNECIDIPSAFTPNGDGFNDTWVIEGIEKYPEATISVFNRWGQEIYRARGSDEPWNGKYKNSNKLPAGTYMYVIELNEKTLNNKYSGTITVIH